MEQGEILFVLVAICGCFCSVQVWFWFKRDERGTNWKFNFIPHIYTLTSKHI